MVDEKVTSGNSENSSKEHKEKAYQKREGLRKENRA